MAYIALYRKYRPKTFSEIYGQDHITKTLKNQLINNRAGHAYLFNGGRGTGKTSAAKVFARAINCLNPKDGEPCNKCEICKEILDGSLTDVVEMDAASNNSVEDIRAIRDEVNFLPTKAKYRVYIIDEVHMLSTGAFNALLKTLEEPPEHVKFILATTEPQKIPTTILSRCQRFDFKKISNENIIKRLKLICDESNINITDEALNLIAVLSEGAMRDGISILERCIQDEEKEITLEKIKDLVGIPSLTYVNELCKNLIDKNEIKCLETIDDVINNGKELVNFIWEILKYLKDILVFKSGKNLEIYSEEEKQKIEELSQKVSKERLMEMIYFLSNLENEMKWSSQKTIVFQTGILKLCYEEKSSNLDEVNARLEKIEDKLKNGIQVNQVQDRKTNIDSNIVSNMSKINNTGASKLENQSKVSNTSKISTGKPSQSWQGVLDLLKKQGKISLFANLNGTQAVEVNDMTLEIIFPRGINAFGRTVLEKIENKNDLKNAVMQEYGKEMFIKYKDVTATNTTDKKESLTENFGDFPINIIEE